MATVIGSLKVLLGLNSAGFNTGLAKAKGGLDTFQLSTSRTGAALASLGSRFVGVATGAVAGLLAFNRFRTSFENLDRINETSKELGISTESLRGLELAASKSGVAADQLHNAMRKLGSGIADAGDDSSEFAKAIKQLGLNSETLVNVPLDEQLRLVADGLSKIGNANKRLGIASGIFGLRRVGILNVLSGGRDSIDKAIEDARKAGGLFSNQQLADVDRADDAWKDLKFTIGSFVDELNVSLAPALTRFFQALTSGIQHMRSSISMNLAIIQESLFPKESLEQLQSQMSAAMTALTNEQNVAANLLNMGVQPDFTTISRLQADVDSIQKRIDAFGIPGPEANSLGLSEFKSLSDTSGRGRFGSATAAELGIDPTRPLFGGGAGGGLSTQVPSNIKKMTSQLDQVIELLRVGIRGPNGQVAVRIN